MTWSRISTLTTSFLVVPLHHKLCTITRDYVPLWMMPNLTWNRGPQTAELQLLAAKERTPDTNNTVKTYLAYCGTHLLTRLAIQQSSFISIRKTSLLPREVYCSCHLWSSWIPFTCYSSSENLHARIVALWCWLGWAPTLGACAHLARIAEHLQDTTDILLPRCYLTHVNDRPKRLHAFCDASKKA